MPDMNSGEGGKKESFLAVPGPASASLSQVSTNQSHQSRPRDHNRSQSRPRLSLHSTRSYVDAHGSYFTEREASVATGPERDVEKSLENAFEVGWDGDDDPADPKNMPTAKKWLVVIILAFGALCVTCASSEYTMTYDQMDKEFGNSRIVATLGLSLFVFGLGLSPMVLGPLSEFYGRRVM